MMKKIAYVRPDGGVSVVHPVLQARRVGAITVDGVRIETDPTPFEQLIRLYGTDNLSPEWAETEDEFLDRIRNRDVPADALVVIVVDELPDDRTNRAAWVVVDGRLVVAPPSSNPDDYPLNRFQFEGMLLTMGVTFDQIEAAIDATGMTATEKAFAISRLRNAVTYNRGHPLIPMLMPAFGLTDAQVDAAWMTAKEVH